MNTVVLGFDPGFHGAMACITINSMDATVQDFPIRSHRVYNKLRKRNATHTEFIVEDVADMVRPYRKDIDGINADVAVYAQLEAVASRTGQGITSAWTFGFGVGFLTGILAAFKIPCLDAVPPQKWKSALLENYSILVKETRSLTRDKHLTEEDLRSFKKNRDKEIQQLELEKAKLLFPALAGNLSLSKDGRTDALLIAYYGACSLGNNAYEM